MTRIVAVTGVDGAGKSTLVRLLRERGLPPGAVFESLKAKPCFELVTKYQRRPLGDHRDWLGGSFAEAVAAATAFDFLAHYSANIAPLIGRVPYVVCDRYAVCYAAYVRAIRSPLSARDLFHGVRPPDLTLHIECPSHLLPERYPLRGGAGEDEFPELMAAFQEAYLEEFTAFTTPVRRIRNDSTAASGFAAVLQALTEAGFV